MFDITSILDHNTTRADVDAQSRKRAIEIAAEVLAERNEDLTARTLFDELMNRERLGSTALGDGVAIPHCRTACDRIHGAFLRLNEPVDYDAPDGAPVDLLFVLVVPPEESNAHLEVLAALARLFQDPDNRRSLREQASDSELYKELVSLVSSQAA
ncbi:MAG: PTS sugar transporter subunit IIA [Pseudomonadales bacterium]